MCYLERCPCLIPLTSGSSTTFTLVFYTSFSFSLLLISFLFEKFTPACNVFPLKSTPIPFPSVPPPFLLPPFLLPNFISSLFSLKKPLISLNTVIYAWLYVPVGALRAFQRLHFEEHLPHPQQLLITNNFSARSGPPWAPPPSRMELWLVWFQAGLLHAVLAIMS